MSNVTWKSNWDDTQKHLKDWWNQKGFVIGKWGRFPDQKPIVDLEAPASLGISGEDYFMGGAARAQVDHYNMSRSSFVGDVVPVVAPDLGPGSLCLHLGCKGDFSRQDTIWFDPVFHEIDDVEEIPELKFTGDDPYWQATEAYLRELVPLAEGKYFVGLPDLCHDMDVLASLRDPNNLLLDLVEEPEWVHASLDAINVAYKEVYNRIADIIDPDGSKGTASRSFFIWSPGRTGKLQCDTSAMFSEKMFDEFVAPRLNDLCQFVDYPLYHLDGTTAIRHLDSLLKVDGLRAIEWTPEAGQPGGADPIWHDMYRRILDAGKSVQIVYIKPEEVPGLFDAIGTNGVYVMPDTESPAEMEELLKAVEKYR